MATLRTISRELALAAALLSGGAAAIHAAVIGPHLREYVLYGLLFAATAIAQAAWAPLVLAAPSARVLLAGAVGNAGVVGGWALSRTVGLPVGAEAWTPEPVEALDVAATAFELGIVAASGLLLAGRARHRGVPADRTRRVAATGAAVIAAITAAAFAATGDAISHHDGAGERAHVAQSTHGDHAHP